MSKLDEAGLPDAPEGMHWYLYADYDRNIRLALMAPREEDDLPVPFGDHKIVKSAPVVNADRDFPQEIYPGLLVNRAHEILGWWEIMENNKTWLGVTGRAARV